MGISAQQFEQLKDRVGGGRRRGSAVAESESLPPQRRHRRILGIDPSLRGTGYGIIELTSGPCPDVLAQGTIKTRPTWERSRCLLSIVQTLRTLVQKHHPTVCIIEGLFYAQNLKTALIMGEARGASVVAAAEGGLDIFEIAPRKVKQAIVGYGAAQKTAVARMVQHMLDLSDEPEPDAADALALALAYANESACYRLTPRKKL
jgi:crossover junction endodeoxyribonuclease RuvC